jgi:hypothetical protein
MGAKSRAQARLFECAVVDEVAGAGMSFAKSPMVLRLETFMKLTLAACILGMIVGCEGIKNNPRTAGTIGGGAAGAAIGAAVDKDHPAQGAVIGGAVGAGAGNLGGKVYKDQR